MRRVTIIIEETSTLSSGSVRATTDSNTYGNGAVSDHIAQVAKAALGMWASMDPRSSIPREDPPRTGRPRPANGRPE